MRSSRPGWQPVAVALLFATGLAGAQEDRSQQALARAQALLRQVSAQKQELETANARLSAEVAALEQKLGRAEAGLKETSANLAAEQRKAERTGGTLDSTRERLNQAEGRLRETDTNLRNTSATLQERERKLAEMESRLAETESRLADSESKNLLLYQANVELLELYRDKGPLAAVLQREPTGLKRVQIENIVEEYRGKLDEARVEIPDGAAPVGAASGPSTP